MAPPYICGTAPGLWFLMDLIMLTTSICPSACLHLLNQRPNCYECTSAAQTITACGEDYIQHVVPTVCTAHLQRHTHPRTILEDQS